MTGTDPGAPDQDDDGGPVDPDDPLETYQLRLYVAGQTPRCVRALANLKKFCEENLKGRYTIELVDLLQNPQLAEGDQILAIPTLVRKLPPPMKKLIGDLSSQERMFVGLDLRPRSARAADKAADGPRVTRE